MKPKTAPRRGRPSPAGRCSSLFHEGRERSAQEKETVGPFFSQPRKNFFLASCTEAGKKSGKRGRSLEGPFRQKRLTKTSPRPPWPASKEGGLAGVLSGWRLGITDAANFERPPESAEGSARSDHEFFRRRTWRRVFGGEIRSRDEGNGKRSPEVSRMVVKQGNRPMP